MGDVVPIRSLAPCLTCGGTDWWLRQSEWLCGTCHPDPANMRPVKIYVVTGKSHYVRQP